jgi:hypothetical protein
MRLLFDERIAGREEIRAEGEQTGLRDSTRGPSRSGVCHSHTGLRGSARVPLRISSIL